MGLGGEESDCDEFEVVVLLSKDVLDALLADLPRADEAGMDLESDDVDRASDETIEVDFAWIDDDEEVGVWDSEEELLSFVWGAVISPGDWMFEGYECSLVVSEAVAV